MLLAGDFYLYVGFLISFLIFKCSFLFCMWKHFLKFAQKLCEYRRHSLWNTKASFVFRSFALYLHCKLCEDRLRSLENIKVNFMFHSLALSLQGEPCENWLKKYEESKSCVFYCTCGVDYGVVPRSRVLQLWMRKSIL